MMPVYLESAGLQLRPVQAERIRHRRDAQQSHSQLFPALIHFQLDEVPCLDDPFIKPHFYPVLPQSLRNAHYRLIVRAIAQEDFVSGFVRHTGNGVAQSGRRRLRKRSRRLLEVPPLHSAWSVETLKLLLLFSTLFPFCRTKPFLQPAKAFYQSAKAQSDPAKTF
jgi:hypothetical protein